MITIRPVSDLRNKFTEIEDTIKKGKPVLRIVEIDFLKNKKNK